MSKSKDVKRVFGEKIKKKIFERLDHPIFMKIMATLQVSKS